MEEHLHGFVQLSMWQVTCVIVIRRHQASCGSCLALSIVSLVAIQVLWVSLGGWCGLLISQALHMSHSWPGNSVFMCTHIVVCVRMPYIISDLYPWQVGADKLKAYIEGLDKETTYR